MGRRQSGWQQFSENFDSTYGTFSKFFSALESRDIMNEEVETVYGKDLGLSKHAAPTKYKYAGQTYDKQITPTMLKSLRDQRLVDVETKYSGLKAGLELQKLQADIESTKAGTASTEAGTENMSQRTKLLVAQFPDLAKKIGYENLSTQASTSLTLARKEDILRMLPHNERIAAAQLVNLKWDNKYLDATFDSRVGLAAEKHLTSVEGTAQAVEGTAQAVEGTAQAEQSTEQAEIKTKADRLAFEEDSEISDAKVASNLTDYQVNTGTNNETLARQGALANWRKTEFETTKDAQMALSGVLSESGDQESLEMAQFIEKGVRTNEFEWMMHDSDMLKSQLNKAVGQGPDAIEKLLEETHGIDDVVITENDDGSWTMKSYDHGGEKNGKLLREIKGATYEIFSQNLSVMSDTSEMLALSGERMIQAKNEADAAYSVAHAEATKAGKPLTKDQWAISLIQKNPNDPMGWIVLLNGGDGTIDMEHIQSMLKTSSYATASDEANANQGAQGDTSSTDNNDKGLGNGNGAAGNTTSNVVDDARKVVESLEGNSTKKTHLSVDKRLKEARKTVAKYTTTAGIEGAIEDANAKIDKIHAKWKKNYNPSTGHIKKGKGDDADIKRLRLEIEALEEKKTGLSQGGSK